MHRLTTSWKTTVMVMPPTSQPSCGNAPAASYQSCSPLAVVATTITTSVSAITSATPAPIKKKVESVMPATWYPMKKLVFSSRNVRRSKKYLPTRMLSSRSR
jgi:hypothetical protein